MSVNDIVMGWAQLLLSWQVLGFALALIVVSRFRSEIAALLSRIKTGRIGGLQFETCLPADQEATAKQTEEASPEKPGSLETYVKDNPTQVIAKYSELWDCWSFERAFNVIFGSQIRALEYLAAKGEAGETVVTMSFFYREYLTLSGNAGSTIYDYFGFLESFRFIDRDGEGANVRFRITDIGIRFLQYIKRLYPMIYIYKPW